MQPTNLFRSWRIGVLPILLALLLTACANRTQPSAAQTQPVQVTPAPGGSYTNISVEELQNMLAYKDFTFINVHTPFAGEIEGTDLSIPYDEIEQNLDRLPANKDAKIVLYCSSGHMSRIAAETLARLGYSNVQNLEGGMAAWKKAGLPLAGK